MQTFISPSQYEFTADQNVVIGGLAGKMKLVAIFLVTIGILSAMVNWVQGSIITGLILGLVYALIGVWTFDAARSFRKIVDTQGSDISHLIDALKDMRRIYTLQFWVILVASILILIAIGSVIGIMGVSQRY